MKTGALWSVSMENGAWQIGRPPGLQVWAARWAHTILPDGGGGQAQAKAKGQPTFC